MKTISLCMIVKNEEDVIGRCLESAKDLVDEIIIVDTGSTDKTKEIVQQFTDKIFDFEWIDDFAAARNFSFSKATCDYILWLDADDVILPEDQKQFLELKESLDGTIDMYQLRYNYSQDANGHPKLVQHRERLLRREYGYKWKSPIHEVISPTGNIKKLDITVTHKKHGVKNPRRNVEIFEKMKEKGIPFDDRQEYSYAKEYFALGEHDKAIELFTQFIKKNENRYKQVRSFMYYSILSLAECYRKLNDRDKQIETLFTILKYEIPRCQCCVKIGDIFLKEKNYEVAKFWNELALQNRNGTDVHKSGDKNIDYMEFFPYINLCTCYYNLGDHKKAYEYNELAGKIKPDSSIYLNNKKLFE